MNIRKYILILFILAFTFFGCYEKKDDQSPLLFTAYEISSRIDYETSSRIDAAVKTATNNCNCNRIQPFYWEIGDKNEKIVSASIPETTHYDESSPMYIASSSKWIWGAYVLERLKKDNGSQPGINERSYLRMMSGYTNLEELYCIGNTTTVYDCYNAGNNSTKNSGDENKFYYESGHFQAYAVLIFQNLKDMLPDSLTNEILNYLGHDIDFSYKTTLLAGGGYCTPAAYRVFLQKILNRNLAISDYLGVDAVCAQPENCPSEAEYTPLPSTEYWHYSYGHWVEDDPNTGDGSFSSPGAFGFYPWINNDKDLYGIVARQANVLLEPFAYNNSAFCGSLIRKAYNEGKEQTDDCY